MSEPLPPPSLEQLRDCWMEDCAPSMELVKESTSPDDHGYGWHYVFKRIIDDTYWSLSGVCQNGGDYHELRELCCSSPCRVYPHEKIITTYTTEKA